MKKDIMAIIHNNSMDEESLDVIEQVLTNYVGFNLSDDAGDVISDVDNSTLNGLLIATGKAILYNELEQLLASGDINAKDLKCFTVN